MHEFKKFGKKLFTMSVVGMTMVWSVGLSAFVPAGVAAASCPELAAGDLFKVPTVKSNPATTAVYLLTSDMKRKQYSHSSIFESWHGNVATAPIKEIPVSCIDAYDLAGAVNYRPGSALLKSPLSPTIWAVVPGNQKVKVEDPAVLAATYGANWATTVKDTPDVWFAFLPSKGTAPLTALHDGQVVKKATEATVYYVWEGKLRKVEGTLPSYVSKDVRTVSDATFNAIPMDSTTVTPATVTANPSQSTGGTVTPPPATGGNLSVSLAADTPVQPAGGLADGTAFNKMLKVNLRAASKDVKVTSLTITRTGLINNTYVTGVSVWDSRGYRKGNVMTSFNSSNQVTIGFGTDPILVAAGATEVVTVAFNLSADAGSGSVGATIADKAHIVTDAMAVEGTFPVAGNIMSVVDGGNSLAAFTVTSTAVGGNALSSDAANVSVGDVKEIGKFRFTETTGRNDLAVKGMVFFLEGNARDKDYVDFEVLAQDNSVLGKTQYAGNRYVTVMFTSPYIVPQSQSRNVTLRAKVADGSGNYMLVKIQNDFDVMVEDNALHYQLLPSTFTATGAADGYFKVREGSLTLSKSANSASGNVSAGATSVELGSFDVTAVGEDMEIQKIGVGITTSGPNMSMPLTGNLRLVAENGDTLVSFAASSAGDALYTGGSQRSLSQYWTIPSGKTVKLRVIGDIRTTATSTGYQVKIGNFYAKRIASQNFVDGQPTSSNVGTSANVVTVQSNNLTLAKHTAQGNATVSAGSKSVVLGQFVVQAGSAEAVRLTNLVLKNSGTEPGVKNLRLLMGSSTASMSSIGLSTDISSPSASSSNSFSFDGAIAGNTIPANGIRIIQVLGDVESSASNAGTFIWTVDSHTYIGSVTNNPTTVDTDYTGQTMTVGAVNVIISAINDSETASEIKLPSSVADVMGKWTIEAQNENVSLDRITFFVTRPDGSTKSDAAEYGTLSLYDASAPSTPIAQTSFVGGTGVRFDKTAMLTVLAGQTKTLVLKSTVAGSGTMNPATTSAFFIAPSSTTNLVLSTTNGQIEGDKLDFGTNGTNYASHHATSSFQLFHNAAPTIKKESIGTALSSAASAQIFRYSVTNNGDRALRLSTTTFNVSASGFLGDNSTTGSVHTFALWELNDAGGLDRLLAYSASTTHNTDRLGATLNTDCIGGVSAKAPNNLAVFCVNAASSSINLVFGQFTDENSAFDNLKVEAGATKKYALVANTLNATLGKATSVTSPQTARVTASLVGSRGYSLGDATHEANWANGVLQYYYTPTTPSTEVGPFSASDSYTGDATTGDQMSIGF